ncbi:MAG: hypothetical protein JSR45_17070 [Proteobacteria bacterium]|nr:hypothetical protein [Pseudomonadota bacterium]
MELVEPSVAFWVTALLGPPLVFCACAVVAHLLFGRERRPKRGRTMRGSGRGMPGGSRPAQ